MKSDKNKDELDVLLKSCLHTEQKPDAILHQKVLQKWKEQSNMRKKKSYKAVAAAAAVILLSAVSVNAAIRFFTPSEVASELGSNEIAELFESDAAILVNETKEGEQYLFTFLGMTEGENLSQLDRNGDMLDKEEFYAVMAISNKDGSALSMEEFYESEDGYFISPLIQGLQPWSYNIASMNGSYLEDEMDGIVYRMIACDKIGYFADRKLYLCVSNTSFYETEAYNYDEATGMITRNEDYKGTNLLFDLPIDSSRADAALAEKYLKELEQEWNEPDEEPEDGYGIDHPDALADYTLCKEALEKTPDEADALFQNMGMTVTNEQTKEAKDGAYSFEQATCDGDSNVYSFFEESFQNGITWSSTYSESETEADLVIIAARLNEDGTATCRFYEKTYQKE